MPEPSKLEKPDLREITDSSQNSTNRVQSNPSAKVIAWKQVSEPKVDDVTERASQALDEPPTRVKAPTSVVQAGDHGCSRTQ